MSAANENPDIIAANLAAVEAHFHSEATNEVEAALDLYTDDVVWEAPARGLRFEGKRAVADNYTTMFAKMEDVGVRNAATLRHRGPGGGRQRGAFPVDRRRLPANVSGDAS